MKRIMKSFALGLSTIALCGCLRKDETVIRTTEIPQTSSQSTVESVVSPEVITIEVTKVSIESSKSGEKSTILEETVTEVIKSTETQITTAFVQTTEPQTTAQVTEIVATTQTIVQSTETVTSAQISQQPTTAVDDDEDETTAPTKASVTKPTEASTEKPTQAPTKPIQTEENEMKGVNPFA